MPSLLAAVGSFCGAGNLDGGSGGLTGGLQICCFSVDLVLVRPSESPEKNNPFFRRFQEIVGWTSSHKVHLCSYLSEINS